MARYRPAVEAVGEDLGSGILYEIDEEKDPRNLLLVFEVVRRAVTKFPKQMAPDVCEAIAEHLFSYFPISFRPPPNDKFGVKPEQLSEGLDRNRQI